MHCVFMLSPSLSLSHTHTHIIQTHKQVHHVDGHVVTLARQGVTKPLLVEKIEGEGMPKPDNV